MADARRVLTLQALKRIVARLPDRWQAELKRIHYGREIRRGTFVSEEPEFEILSNFVAPGDWVVDIGANIGQYTKRFSDLVGAQGRVIALEPVPETFSLLAANARQFAQTNVSLINAAASDKLEIAGMIVPRLETGLVNYYEARLDRNADCFLPVLTIPLDSLCANHAIALVKIDAEGHELRVLLGMQSLIKQYHPTLIVETRNEKVIEYLTSLGYVDERLGTSPNLVCKAA